MVQDDSGWYYLPDVEKGYHEQFLIALALAVKTGKLKNSELQYFFDKGWTQYEIAQELVKRVKDGT